MVKISNDLRNICSKQTEDLFDYFLQINEYEEAFPQKRKSYSSKMLINMVNESPH